MFANPYVRLTNNWLHDVATGLWAACLLVAVVIVNRATGVGAEALSVLAETAWLMFWLMIAALVVITVTGAARLLYWRAETPPEQLRSKRPALIGKHIAFLVVYGGGTVAAWLLVDGLASAS